MNLNCPPLRFYMLYFLTPFTILHNPLYEYDVYLQSHAEPTCLGWILDSCLQCMASTDCKSLRVMVFIFSNAINWRIKYTLMWNTLTGWIVQSSLISMKYTVRYWGPEHANKKSYRRSISTSASYMTKL
jgi:hypothetical protein